MIVESIKQAILQLDAGSFQNLCNSYLYKTGYLNIVALGGEAGTRKTTSGTPDTYFTSSDGKYVFVEYTTQRKNLFSKIKSDIQKCLDVSITGITHDKISEIIFCHTSSNIKPSQYEELKALCEDVGIRLNILGIDIIAEDLYLFYHGIARDYLGISISTGQIQTYDDFVKSYNSSKIAAPINTKFLFRDEEIQKIDEAYQNVNVVILAGAAGTGKTRLALHYAKQDSDINNQKLYCISSKALPIYEDLRRFIDKPGNYFLFIDDANELSGLEHIIRYTTLEPEGYNVRVLISVRDYALKKVINDIREITTYKHININPFTDDEIKALLKTTLGITNSSYHDRIIKIAEGNARIAILAGKMACDSNRLNSIDDVTQLYEDYYGTFLEKHQLLNDIFLQKTAGVVAFLEAIHLDHITSQSILEEVEIDRDNFIESIRKLHDQEIIDIYNNKAVLFSDQCLSNYLLKYLYFDKRLINLSTMIKSCFKHYQQRTIASVSTLVNIYRNQDLLLFVEKEIKDLWSELSKEKSPYFFDFVKAFFPINPTETLLILKDKIESQEKVVVDIANIDTEKGKNYQIINDDIIEILGGFADTADLPTALDLFFQYYLKRPDLYMEFYHAVIRYFGIRKDSYRNEYYTQITFLEKIKEYSDDWKNDAIVILFLNIAQEFLKLFFTPIEGGRKHTFTIYQIPLVISKGVKAYRDAIWKSIYAICKIDKYKQNIRKILNSYGDAIQDDSVSVMQFDLTHIELIMKSYFSEKELNNCLLANKLTRIYNRINISCEEAFHEYLQKEQFRLYQLLIGVDYKEDISYEEYDNLSRQAIEEYVINCDIMMFKRLIDVCSNLSGIDECNIYKVSQGLKFAFDALSNKKEYFIDAIKYYVENDTPCDLNPERFMNILFSLSPDSAVYELITSYEYRQKNVWLYAFYHELPSELISEAHIQGLYSFLSDQSDRAITSSVFRDVNFLHKYSHLDKDVFVKGCRIILNKYKYSPFMVHIYFSMLFNHYHKDPKDTIREFNCNLDLLEDIYFALLSYNNIHDYNGAFLKEFYLVKESVLNRYISYLIQETTISIDDFYELNRCFFQLDDYLAIYNKIFEQLINNCKYPQLLGSSFLETILMPSHDKQDLLSKQDTWIKQCIHVFHDDVIKMYSLFSIVSKLSNDRKKEYVELFLKYNQSYEDFKNIPLTPTTWTWSGSAVPLYSSWISFLESLLPSLTGIKWIQHKHYLETEIERLKKAIENEEIEKILRG